MAERASQKQSIESQLAERQRMLAGIQSEIKQLQAEEARRQAQLSGRGRGPARRAAAGGVDGPHGGGRDRGRQTSPSAIDSDTRPTR